MKRNGLKIVFECGEKERNRKRWKREMAWGVEKMS